MAQVSLARTNRSSTSDGETFAEQVDDAVVKQALSSGVDIRDYSKHIEEQLKTVEHEAVKDYIKEADKLASLHQEISGCDGILQRMEEMLAKFQADLGTISCEIQTLQEQSVHMNIKLKNRQSLRGKLSQLIDEMTISSHLISAIVETPVEEQAFKEQLHELQHKLSFVKEQSSRDVLACDEIDETLEKLKIKAVEKIREFLLRRFSQFRIPLSNYEVKESSLLKFPFFYTFLMKNDRQVAAEVRDDYANTMGKVFYSYFKTLTRRLMELQLDDVASKDDLLGAEDVARTVGLFSTKPVVRNKATVFTLGNRQKVLDVLFDADCIVPHAAKDANEKFQFEALFRSFQFALVENSCSEYLFISDFFMDVDEKPMALFSAVMGQALAVISKCVETYIATSYDCIALLLCIHLIYRYRDRMAKRNVTVLYHYWEKLLQQFWERFAIVIKMNIDSIRTTDAVKVSTTDRPHYMVRRCAEFSSALIVINKTMPEKRVQPFIDSLQNEIQNLLCRFRLPNKIQELIFMINNYDVILSIFSESITEGTEEIIPYKQALQAKSVEYVHEVLLPYFGELMTFVHHTERLIENSQTEELKRYTNKATAIVKSFSASWKQSIEKINQDIMGSFSNYHNGTNILQIALTQLVEYYHRFIKILNHSAFGSCSARNDLVNIHTLMVEINKHKPTF